MNESHLGPRAAVVYVRSQTRADGGIARLMAGRIGADVTGVDVRTPAGKTVEATASQGYFLAWFPDKENETRKSFIVLHFKDGRDVQLPDNELYGKPYTG